MIPNRPASKKIVLCIDDDEALLLYEKTLLGRSGYVVFTAASSQEGLGLITTCECDAVLIGHNPPTMDGYEVAREIKRLLPQIILLVISDGEVPFHTLALADAFIPKREVARELLPMIAELYRLNHSKPAEQQDLSTRIADKLAQIYAGSVDTSVFPPSEPTEPTQPTRTRKEDS